jgi:hypothetical protein
MRYFGIKRALDVNIEQLESLTDSFRVKKLNIVAAPRCNASAVRGSIEPLLFAKNPVTNVSGFTTTASAVFTTADEAAEDRVVNADEAACIFLMPFTWGSELP